MTNDKKSPPSFGGRVGLGATSPRTNPENYHHIHAATCTCWQCLDTERRAALRIARIIGTVLLISMVAMGAAVGATIHALILWGLS